MKCPHGCGVTYDGLQAFLGRPMIADGDKTAWYVAVWRCPHCEEITLDLLLMEQRLIENGIVIRDGTKILNRHRVWPRSSRQAPPDVPTDLARDYREASEVLDRSPRASAALSRRCLQHVLVDHLNVAGGDLNAQIDAVTGTGKLPSQVEDALHALRIIGNFAAHPVKAKTTGDIVDVEPDEAEWTLEVLEQLFDHVFVAPARAQARKAAFNQKLQAAGRQPLP
jgi:Domain of unknown function (DUF4145)